MELQQQHNPKRARVTNGTTNNILTAHQNNNEDDDDGGNEAAKKLRTWHHPSSRIFRVSRASGGKDRHSKVYTAKGLRDRRVRLSVSTAIQFYDLQDRLGYDQPSKAIEWLIKAAADAIAELPSLNANFTEPPILQQSKQVVSNQENSSASETSKGSVLSLSRSESRVKARERARERAKDKEKDGDEQQQSSFTALLTGNSSNAAVVTSVASPTANFIRKQMRSSSTADYFGFRQQQEQKAAATQQQNNIPYFGNNNSSSGMGMVPFSNAGDGGHSTEMQQFAFLQDHYFPAAAAAAVDYNLNFSISSPSLAGFHRGTLQSNSPTHHHQLQQHHHHQQQQMQRMSSPLDGANVAAVPFFFGTPAAASENPYSAGFDSHLQHLELKGKGKN